MDTNANRNLKIGLLSMAHMHAYSYAEALTHIPGVELTLIADADRKRGEKAAGHYHTRWIGDYEVALKEPLDAVIICSENSRHADMAVAAAEAGIGVLCEKPLATTVEDAKRMVEACQQHRVVLQTAFPMRYNTPIAHMKAQIERGDLGRIIVLNGTNRGQNPGGWFVVPELAGGGAVFDHTVHIIDVMRWYTGSEVKEVYAEVDTRYYDLLVDDTGLLTLEFENGVIAAHDPSWSRPGRSFPTWGDVTLEVIGSEGVANIDAFGQYLSFFGESQGKLRHVAWGDDADLQMVRDFLLCLDDLQCA